MKKVTTLGLLLLISTLSVLGQGERNRVSINAGPSLHGTGDLGGFSLGLMHDYDFSRRLGISNGLTTTIHYGRDGSYNYVSPGGAGENRGLHFTTAGIQLNSVGQYHIVTKRDIKLSFYAGALLRFQSTSMPSMYGVSRNLAVYPEPFYVIYQNGKANTITPGYLTGFTLRARIAPKYFAGIRAGFQNDTNGDVITVASLLFERVFALAGTSN